jgi:DNA-directed RNA polymerase subunit RPC12/RpoP
MSDFKFPCPNCKRNLQCDEQFSGREIQCPNCNVMIRIPRLPGKTAQYQAESGKTWATHLPPGGVAKPEGLSLKAKSKKGKPGD